MEKEIKGLNLVLLYENNNEIEIGVEFEYGVHGPGDTQMYGPILTLTNFELNGKTYSIGDEIDESFLEFIDFETWEGFETYLIETVRKKIS